MGIIQAPSVLPGQVGVVGAIKYMVTTDNLATITTAAYLNNLDLAVNPLAATDILGVTYSYVANTNSGSFGFFSVSISNGVITLAEQPTSGISLPTTADNIAVYTNTSGNLSQNLPNALNTTTVSSATPGTVRSIIGAMVQSATTMTSGNIVGVRGVVNMVGSSTSAFVYGVQGKIIATGTLASGQFQAGVFGQLDISAATINAGQLAPIWGDYGTTSGTLTSQVGLYGIAMTNTTAAVLAGQLYLYGGATNLMLLDTNSGLSGTTYFQAGGSGAVSGTIKKIQISVDGTTYYIPCATVVS